MQWGLVEIVTGKRRNYFRKRTNTVRIRSVRNSQDVLGAKPLSFEEGDPLLYELKSLVKDTFFDLH